MPRRSWPRTQPPAHTTKCVVPWRRHTCRIDAVVLFALLYAWYVQGRSVRRDLVGYYYKDGAAAHGSTPRLQLPNLFGNKDRPPTPVSNMKRLREG